jgi:hypothetical protein
MAPRVDGHVLRRAPRTSSRRSASRSLGNVILLMYTHEASDTHEASALAGPLGVLEHPAREQHVHAVGQRRPRPRAP